MYLIALVLQESFISRNRIAVSYVHPSSFSRRLYPMNGRYHGQIYPAADLRRQITSCAYGRSHLSRVMRNVVAFAIPMALTRLHENVSSANFMRVALTAWETATAGTVIRRPVVILSAPVVVHAGKPRQAFVFTSSGMLLGLGQYG